MTLLDAVRARPSVGWEMIVSILRRVNRRTIDDGPAESVWTVARDRRRLRSVTGNLRNGLAEQVVRLLCEGIDRPCYEAQENIRKNLRAMGPVQLRGMMLAIKNRAVFVARDEIESDVIGMLRTQLKG